MFLSLSSGLLASVVIGADELATSSSSSSSSSSSIPSHIDSVVSNQAEEYLTVNENFVVDDSIVKFPNKNNNDKTKAQEQYTSAANEDMITDLPGLNFDPGFQQFAGYITVSEADERNIFYWYVESQNDPSTDPLVFWTNGGPGCSGLLGFGTEMGPYIFRKDGTLESNPYSWNTIANMVFIEQPAGVGNSYSKNENDYKHVGDQRAAEDNYVFVQQFLQRFPERKTNGLYFASESYGGHYVPQFTEQVLKRNTDNTINFRGFLVGNPYVDPPSNAFGSFSSYYSHGLVALPLYKKWLKACVDDNTASQTECKKYTKEIYHNMKRINPYALDYPVCLEKNNEERNSQAMRLIEFMAEIPFNNNDQDDDDENEIILNRGPPFLPAVDKYKPCSENHFTAYMNRKEVINALHAKPEVEWQSCTDRLHYSRKDAQASLISLYESIVNLAKTGKTDLNMLVYSGDDDSVCALTGTEYWIFDLGVDADVLWKPWLVHGQTAGFVTTFDLGSEGKGNFTFATVHGAGHEVPSYRPREALEMFKRYFSGEWS